MLLAIVFYLGVKRGAGEREKKLKKIERKRRGKREIIILIS